MLHTQLAIDPLQRKMLCLKSATPSNRSRRKIVFWALLTCFTLGFNQPIAANADSCVDLLTDSGLEDSAIWQTKSNDDFSLFSSLLTHTGTHAAYLAGRNDAVDRLATELALPATNVITLSFWWQLQSEEEQRFTDKLAILVVDNHGRVLQRLGELSGRDHSNQWQQDQIDLSAWAGQTVWLHFLAQSNSELVTDFFLDDIVVTACPEST